MDGEQEKTNSGNNIWERVPMDLYPSFLIFDNPALIVTASQGNRSAGYPDNKLLFASFYLYESQS